MLKTNVVTLIIGAAGTISNSFRKHLRNILGKHEMNYRKRPYRAPYTCCGKYKCRSGKLFEV